MRLGRIIELVHGEVLMPSVAPDLEIAEGCGADLISDVVAGARPGAVLLTGLCNLQVVQTARAMDIAAVVFVRGKRPLEHMLVIAQQEGVPLVCSTLSMFEACGRLYQAGLSPSFPGCTISANELPKVYQLDVQE